MIIALYPSLGGSHKVFHQLPPYSLAFYFSYHASGQILTMNNTIPDIAIVLFFIKYFNVALTSFSTPKLSLIILRCKYILMHTQMYAYPAIFIFRF